MSKCEEHFTHDTKSSIETQVTEVNVFWTTECIATKIIKGRDFIPILLVFFQAPIKVQLCQFICKVNKDVVSTNVVKCCAI